MDSRKIDTAPLQKRIEALQKQVTPMACEVCWTNSWEPAEESDKDAVRDPTIAGKWMRCAHCLIVEGLLSQKKRIEELEQKLTTYEGKTNFCCECGGSISRKYVKREVLEECVETIEAVKRINCLHEYPWFDAKVEEALTIARKELEKK